VARIVEAIAQYWSRALSCLEAADVLGMSERHFRRLRDGYETAGAEGLIDRRRGRVSDRRVPVHRTEWLLMENRTRYFDSPVKHCHERLQSLQGVGAYKWISGEADERHNLRNGLSLLPALRLGRSALPAAP
jgi:hypothetical protein